MFNLAGNPGKGNLNYAAAAAAAKSLQSCPTLCDPMDGSPRSYLALITWPIIHSSRD